MVCPNCKAETGTAGTFCPYCGAKLTQNTSAEIQPSLPKKKFAIWKIAVPCLVLVLVFLGVFYYFSEVHLTDDEKWAVENCQYLIEHLNDPASFTLHGDILILTRYDGESDAVIRYHDGIESVWMFIEYGAANRFGGMVKSIAGFDTIGYLCELDDDVGNFTDRRERATRLVNNYRSVSVKGYGKEDGDTYYFELKRISADTVNKHLDRS